MIRDTNIVQNSVAKSAMPNIPLVNSTQILTDSAQVVNSQIPQVTTTTVQQPQTSQQTISLVPVVSAIQQPKQQQQQGRPVVKVVPIYDDF